MEFLGWKDLILVGRCQTRIIALENAPAYTYREYKASSLSTCE